MQQLQVLDEQIKLLQRGKPLPILIGGDFNLAVGNCVPGVSGDYAGRSTSLSIHFVDFLCRLCLVVTNSFWPHPPSYTSRTQRSASDLDWILVSATYPASVIDVFYTDMSKHANSDHMSVTAVMSSFDSTRKPSDYYSLPRTWQPLEEGMIARVHNLVYNDDFHPAQVDTSAFAHEIRSEALHDYREQQRRQLLSSDGILQRLSSGMSCIEQFLLPLQRKLHFYRRLRTLLDSLQCLQL